MVLLFRTMIGENINYPISVEINDLGVSLVKKNLNCLKIRFKIKHDYNFKYSYEKCLVYIFANRVQIEYNIKYNIISILYF